MELQGKVALVTGAAQGIGQAVAVRLARAGADVVAFDLLADRLSETGALVQAEGRRVLLVGGDVRERAEAAGCVQRAVSELGRLDVLVNNAGNFRRSPFLEMTEDEWDSVHSVHLKGTMFFCQAAIGAMVSAGIRGSIINLASISSTVGFAGSAAYCTAKGGIPILTKVLAREFGPQGIRVNAIAPGIIDTRMNDWFLQDPDMQRASVAHIPLGYVGKVEEVAAVVLFLASDAASYVTGVTLPVDGGYLTH
jgi:glucose 1-dehydrogenase